MTNASPALSDDELRETLDLMATAVASMSNRIDGLTTVANKQFEVSTEARIAAFAARDQTNPKNMGSWLVERLMERLTITWCVCVRCVSICLVLQTERKMR